MKKIEATIRKTKLAAVEQALRNRGLEGMNVTYVQGFGKEKGTVVTYRGAKATQESHERARVEIIVADEAVEMAIDTIYQAAHTGELGDGRICVTSLENYVRIRTGEIDNDIQDRQTPVRFSPPLQSIQTLDQYQSLAQ